MAVAGGGHAGIVRLEFTSPAFGEGGSFPKKCELIQSPYSRFRANRAELLCSLWAPGQSNDLVACTEQFLDHGRADETCSTGDKNTHKIFQYG